MSFINRQSVAVTTDGSGNFTGYSAAVQGVCWSVTYVPAASNALDTGADITITEEDTGKPIITITNIGTSTVEKFPRAATCDTSGVAITGGVDLIPVFGRIKVVVANGASTKSGTLYFNLV